MKYIELSRGKRTIVSDEDFDRLNKFNWHYATVGYAVRNGLTSIGERRGSMIYMHREIMGLRNGDEKLVDHVNGDGLDNRRENLRVCNKTQNQQNQRPRHTRASKYKGVGYYKRDRKWRARIKNNEKEDIELGKFETEIEAAIAYDEAAKKLHGEYAWLNYTNYPEDFEF